MTRARRLTGLVAMLLTFALVAGVVPALGEPSQSVAFHVTVAGVDLFGMDALQAHDAIAAACTTPTLAPLDAVAAETTFTLEVTRSVSCNVDGMTAAALNATEDTAIVPAWSAEPTSVAKFVAAIAKAKNTKAINAQRVVKKRRLRVTAPVDGRAVVTTAAVELVTDAINTEIAAGGVAQPPVLIPFKVLVAKGPLTLGKTIIVVLKERRVYLYNNSKLQRTYRCAVGMRRYPTPTGTWKIVKKVKNPSWHNNGSAWAAKMPDFIKPGPNNPLGTRALYLNASGIRIHGIPRSENSSIGHAASHGCIRLKNSDAVKLYPLVPVGTPVYIVK